MIFRPELVEKILAGQKTMTRRPVKMRYESGVRAVNCFYKTGKGYAVQPGRGEFGVARIKVTDVRRERWKDISEGAAEREGFTQEITQASYKTARMAFIEYVRGLYPDLDLSDECWVISFELVDREPTPDAGRIPKEGKTA